MYERYFGLREPPFNPTPDPRFFYTNLRFQEAFATLAYGVEQRKGIIVATGEPGTGKTTLLKSFLQSVGPRTHLSCVLDPRLNFVELLGCALQPLGLAPCLTDRVSALERLKPYLLDQLARDHTVAFLLDEAQDIDDTVLDELRLLTDLERGGARLLQLVLIGQPGLEAKLDRPSLRYLRQRIALRARLEPLAEEEVRPYIDFRLAAAGYQGKPIFQTAAVRRIEFFSRGIPRVINIICDNALLVACFTSQVEIGAEIIDEIADDLQLGERGAEQERDFIPADGDAKDDQQRLEVKTPPPNFAERAAPFQARREVGPGIMAAWTGWSERFDKACACLRPAAPWATLVAAIGGALLVMWSHAKSPEALSLVTKPMEEIQQTLTPLPGRIHRAVIENPLWQNALKKLAIEERQSLEWDWSEDRAPATEQNSPREKSRKLAKAGARVDPVRDSERVPRASARAPGSHAVPTARKPSPSSRREEFIVVENSFVRDKPTAGADIVATLRPGTRVEVRRRSGEYFQIRSLGGEAIRGYVHKEDAFFKAVRDY